MGRVGTVGAEWGAAAGSVGRPARDGCGPEVLAAGTGMAAGATHREGMGAQRGAEKYCVARGAVAGLSS